MGKLKYSQILWMSKCLELYDNTRYYYNIFKLKYQSLRYREIEAGSFRQALLVKWEVNGYTQLLALQEARLSHNEYVCSWQQEDSLTKSKICRYMCIYRVMCRCWCANSPFCTSRESETSRQVVLLRFPRG